MDEPPSLLTLAEAAERTGLTVDALRKRVKRGLLEAVKGNDGLVRVRLGVTELASLRPAEGQTVASQGLDFSRAIKALEDTATALRERAERAEARADKLEQARDVALSEAFEERLRVARAEGATDELRHALQRAEEAAQAARVELAGWTSGGPLARAWRAFRDRRP